MRKLHTSDKEFLKSAPIKKGLKNVVLDETSICSVDGLTGELYYRGYAISELVEKSTFEEVSFLLLFGKLPTAFELEFFKEKLVKERDIPDRILMILRSFPRNTTRIELMRTAVSALSLYDEDDYDYTEQANIRKGIRIIAKMPTILAFSHRIRTNQPLIEPSEELSHAGNFYYMMMGTEPTPEIERALDILMMLHAEHDLNSSTFSARVTVSTLSDIYSATVSAIGTLRGPLHGGANEKVIDYLLHEIVTKDNAIPWLDAKLERNEKIMGFGHRVYRVIDPRSKILMKFAKDFSERLSPDEVGHDNLFEIGEILMKEMKEKKNINPNLDLFSAILLYSIGLPPPTFTPIFAVARCVGWIAHSIEQLNNNSLIRPRLRYVGELDLEYIDLKNR